MGRIWRDGKLIGVIGGGSSCRSGCVFPTEGWDDDEPFGFGSTSQDCKGTKQALLTVDDFVGADLMAHNLVVRYDRRVYETRDGLIKCLAPAKLCAGEPDIYVEAIDWLRFPPQDHLAWLFYNFFHKYTDREVVMLVGERLNREGWLYYVPEQVGTSGFVRWTADDEEMNWFQERARWIGTIHIHPGNDCKPSQTDIDDWAEPEKSGMHIVFGRDGSFTVNGAIAERTFELYSNCVRQEQSWSKEQVRYQTSKGRSLEELLKKPKPVVVKPHVRRGSVVAVRRVQKEASSWIEASQWVEESKKDFVEESLEMVGALQLDQDNGAAVMRFVEYNGLIYMVSASQWKELTEWCKGVCPMPKSKKIRLMGVRGGMR
jgi:proteasome lid subunit RPN8/RPN11